MARPTRGPVFAPFEGKYGDTAVWPAELPFPADARDGARRFEYETRGPWSIVCAIRGLAVSRGPGRGVTIYGDRSLEGPREDGYVLRGRVSVVGLKLPAFTCSQLFTHEGRLWDFAILWVTRDAQREGGHDA